MQEKILSVLLLLAVIKNCTAVKCYHCYDLYNGTDVAIADAPFGDALVKCSEKQKDWNSWECPPVWPICIVLSRTSSYNHEVVRTCAAEDFCSLYKPMDGVKVESCRECVTPLCNDITGFPVPTNESEPLFVFNINLHVNKFTLK